MTSGHVHRSIEPVPRDPRDLHLGRHCACGATICNGPIPIRGTEGSLYGCVRTKGHEGLCDNPLIAASKLYWPRPEGES